MKSKQGVKHRTALLSILLLSLALASLALPVYLHRAAPPPAFAPAHVACGLAAVALASAAWTAFGVLAAAASRRESAAGVATLAVSLSAVLLPDGPVAGLPAGSFAASLDLTDFTRGAADTRPVVLLLSCTAFFLFCAVRVLESRRWASSAR